MHMPDGSHGSVSETVERAAAAASDEEAFRQLTEPYRRELHVHCYRMLGSFHDADDALQETFLRSWRHLASFEGRSSLRAWLYRIATNVCLTATARPRVEPAPPLAPPAAMRTAGIEHVTHLSPYPDQLLDELEATAGNPVAHYDLRESVQLAFLAAVQMLPPRQRAVLILRAVLGWSSSAVAALLDATTASVHSALQRARATIEQQHTARRLGTVSTASRDEIEQSPVRRYIEAWEAFDLDRLVGLLRSDAVLTMPPFRLRYEGRRAIAAFFATISSPGAVAGRRLMPIRANRQPAVAAYMLDPGGLQYRASALVVLSIEAEAIAAITGFVDPTLFPVFGLPTALESYHTT